MHLLLDILHRILNGTTGNVTTESEERFRSLNSKSLRRVETKQLDQHKERYNGQWHRAIEEQVGDCSRKALLAICNTFKFCAVLRAGKAQQLMPRVRVERICRDLWTI